MSIKDKYHVQSIHKNLTTEWCLKKHYAHRMPMAVEYPFGLFDKSNVLTGIAIFGPTAPPVPITIFGDIKKHKVRELTRLIVNEELEKNTLSYFLGQCLCLLPKPLCIVSFADSGSGHHGYIYQATNWIYTGEGGGQNNYYVDGKDIHLLTIGTNCERENISRAAYIEKYNIKVEKASPKHRYLYYLGNKTEKKQMQKDLMLKELAYPKGNNKRYDASYKPKIQAELF